MIFANLLPRLTEAISEANKTNINQEVKLIYNEISNYGEISPLYEWLFNNNIDFGIRHDEYRLVVIIKPQSQTNSKELVILNPCHEEKLLFQQNGKPATLCFKPEQDKDRNIIQPLSVSGILSLNNKKDKIILVTNDPRGYSLSCKRAFNKHDKQYYFDIHKTTTRIFGSERHPEWLIGFWNKNQDKLIIDL